MCDVSCTRAVLDDFFTSLHVHLCLFFFFFNDTATTEIYTLSLHDALPICNWQVAIEFNATGTKIFGEVTEQNVGKHRSEEHTSELQSRLHLVCRLLLEKKKKKKKEQLTGIQLKDTTISRWKIEQSRLVLCD